MRGLSFPRPISRGLIEAGWAGWKPDPERSFPRPISRGLIEATGHAVGQHVTTQISPTDKSGPH